MAHTKVNIRMPDLSGLTPMVEIKNQYNWSVLGMVANNLQYAIKSGGDEAIDKVSRRILSIVRRAVKSGAPPPGSGVSWPQLSLRTIERHGYHKIYSLTGQYANSIGLYKYKSRTLVGFPHGSRHLYNGLLTVNQIAVILEHGSMHIPPRPLWAPALKSYGGTQSIKKEMVDKIRKSLVDKTGLSLTQVKKVW